MINVSQNESNPGSTAPRVLVVEDERHIARLLQYVLERQRYEVRVVHAARPALRLLEDFYPHVVLLDLVLPDLDGDVVLRRAQSTPSGEKPKVIVLTGQSGDPERERTIKEMADGFCVKPVAPSVLIRKMSEITPENSRTTSESAQK